MPGKHAPDSSASFYLSLARAIGGALAAVGLVVAIVVIAVNSRGGDEPQIAGTQGASPTPTPTATATGSPSPSPSPTATLTEPMIPRRKLSVEVLNGNGREGAAGEVRDRLQPAGYADIEVGNVSTAARTTIFYRGSLRREARRLLREFPEFERVREATSGTPGTAQLTIVLGQDHQPPG